MMKNLMAERLKGCVVSGKQMFLDRSQFHDKELRHLLEREWPHLKVFLTSKRELRRSHASVREAIANGTL
jgi:hypothetical protein